MVSPWVEGGAARAVGGGGLGAPLVGANDIAEDPFEGYRESRFGHLMSMGIVRNNIEPAVGVTIVAIPSQEGKQT